MMDCGYSTIPQDDLRERLPTPRRCLSDGFWQEPAGQAIRGKMAATDPNQAIAEIMDLWKA